MAYQGSRSFRKLCHEWSRQAGILDRDEAMLSSNDVPMQQGRIGS